VYPVFVYSCDFANDEMNCELVNCGFKVRKTVVNFEHLKKIV